MAKSKTLIKKQTERKTNKELVETIIAAKKNSEWFKIAEILSGPRRRKIIVNLGEIDNSAKENETVVIPGKVLSQGDVTKKLRVAALDFSEIAKDKLLKAKCEVLSITDEIKKNPYAKGVRILK